MESTIEAYSPEWFKTRQGNFTGSELWKLMTKPRSKSELLSKTAETYILEKVWERLSGRTKGGVDNFATEWGNENEPLAKHHYERLKGIQVDSAPLVFKTELDGLTGTPDGLVGEDGMIEIKCPFNGANHLRHCMIISDEYFKSEHPEYYWQIMCYLYLTGRRWCDFISFDPRINYDLGFFTYQLKYNESDGMEIERVVKETREIFNMYLKTFSVEVK